MIGIDPVDKARPPECFQSADTSPGVLVLPLKAIADDEALAMKCPAEPFHDRDVLVTACGRPCLHRKRINISTLPAGQKLGIKEVDDGGLSAYDLGYFDLEQKTLQPLDNSFGRRLSPMS